MALESSWWRSHSLSARWCCPHQRCGPPDVVRIARWTPTLKDNQVLVKVAVTTLNRNRLGVPGGQALLLVRALTGLPQAKGDRPGTEFAGTVEAVGRTSRPCGRRAGIRVQRAAVRRPCRIPGYPPRRVPGHHPGEPVRGGRTQHRGGSCSASSGRPRSPAARRSWSTGPPGRSAAAGGPAAQAAWRQGDRGLWPEHLELAKGPEADRVIDYTAQDFTRDTHRDVVPGCGGQEPFLAVPAAIEARHGSYLSPEFGPLAQNLVLALITPVLGARRPC